MAWGDDTTNAVKEGINDGSFNTDRIISTLGSGDYAALVAANYNGGGYGDWYLPSKEELALMYENLHLSDLGGFASGSYWSSSEASSGFAWGQDFNDGVQFENGKDDPSRVRAVRAF